MAVARALAYAPYADILWTETTKFDMAEAKEFAEGVLAQFPQKLLAYNFAPSFNWKNELDEARQAGLHRELAAMGYKFQFITLAGFHALNMSMFELARNFKETGVAAYSRLQEQEMRSEEQNGYEGAKHQRFVGTAYFDAIQQIASAAGAPPAAAGAGPTTAPEKPNPPS
jgi:isocitrate lyase